jgi:hypothetical protein
MMTFKSNDVTMLSLTVMIRTHSVAMKTQTMIVMTLIFRRDDDSSKKFYKLLLYVNIYTIGIDNEYVLHREY